MPNFPSQHEITTKNDYIMIINTFELDSKFLIFIYCNHFLLKISYFRAVSNNYFEWM